MEFLTGYPSNSFKVGLRARREWKEWIATAHPSSLPRRLTFTTRGSSAHSKRHKLRKTKLRVFALRETARALRGEISDFPIRKVHRNRDKTPATLQPMRFIILWSELELRSLFVFVPLAMTQNHIAKGSSSRRDAGVRCREIVALLADSGQAKVYRGVYNERWQRKCSTWREPL